MSVALIASEIQAAKHVWREVLLCFSLLLGAWKAPGTGLSQPAGAQLPMHWRCCFTRHPKQELPGEVFERTLKLSWAAEHCSQTEAQRIHQRGPEDACLFSGIPMEISKLAPYQCRFPNIQENSFLPKQEPDQICWSQQNFPG